MAAALILARDAETGNAAGKMTIPETGKAGSGTTRDHSVRARAGLQPEPGAKYCGNVASGGDVIGIGPAFDRQAPARILATRNPVAGAEPYWHWPA